MASAAKKIKINFSGSHIHSNYYNNYILTVKYLVERERFSNFVGEY